MDEIKAPFTATIFCPGCNNTLNLMWEDKHKHYECIHMECAMHGTRFKLPLIELEEEDETENA